MSGYKLAQKAKVSPSCIYDWESDKYLPTIYSINGLLKALNITFEDFMKGVKL